MKGLPVIDPEVRFKEPQVFDIAPEMRVPPQLSKEAVASLAWFKRLSLSF